MRVPPVVVCDGCGGEFTMERIENISHRVWIRDDRVYPAVLPYIAGDAFFVWSPRRRPKKNTERL